MQTKKLIKNQKKDPFKEFNDDDVIEIDNGDVEDEEDVHSDVDDATEIDDDSDSKSTNNYYGVNDLLLTELTRSLSDDQTDDDGHHQQNVLPDGPKRKYYLNKSPGKTRKFDKTVVCTCGRKFSYENLYVYHKRWECGQELTCRYCQRSYCSVYYVKRHMKNCKKRIMGKRGSV